MMQQTRFAWYLLAPAAIIDSHVFREGDAVDIGFAPSDCVLLGEDDRRLV